MSTATAERRTSHGTPRSARVTRKAAAAARMTNKATGPAGPAGLRGLALALILTASFMVVLDFSIVNVALPSIEADLGLSAS